MDMFESVGDFLSRCSEFLQSPLRCDRNVPYRNPQSLAGRDENPIMTYQFREVGPSSTIESVAQDADPSVALENEDSFPETEAPAAVKTSLYSHQKRALSFMLEREQDQKTCIRKDQWRAKFNEFEGITT